MQKRNRFTLFVAVLTIAALACNLQYVQPATQDPGANFTAAAQTIAAVVNQTLAPTQGQQEQPPPVNPPAETATPSATASPTFTLSPTIAFTSTNAAVTLSVTVDTNCRVGPGRVYDYIGGLYIGQIAEVYGRNTANNYWYIRLPENPNLFCWVTGEYASVNGNFAALPVFTPPPTPTPKPDFEIKYAGMDTCVGWWLEFKLTNIGPFAFQSYSIVVKDTSNGIAVSGAGDGFTDLGGCVSSSIILSLEPGKSTILSGPAFAHNPNNHEIKATIKLCTKPGLLGECITHTIEFKP
jgi:hypothetical protein